MSQSLFDLWFDMNGATSHTRQRRRKKKNLHRRQSSDAYQVGEEVWARYPDGRIMYVALVTAVNSYKGICTVSFPNGVTSDLSFGHLRRVTVEDIQCARCVDYGQGWSEHGNYGSINVYDRYGELQETHFPGAFKLKDINNDFFMDEDNIIINDHNLDAPLLNDITEGSSYANSSTDLLEQEVFWVRIPDPEEPTATYCNCPIWTASSFVEAEAKAMELINQDVDYLEAVERAKHRRKAPEQRDLLCPDQANVPEAREISSRMESRIAECDAHPLPTESPIWQCQSSIVLTDYQSTTESMNELEHTLSSQHEIDSELAENASSTAQSLTEVKDRTNIADRYAVKEIGTQTDSSPYLSTLTVDLKFNPITLVSNNQPADVVLPLRKCTKRSSNRLSKYCRRMRKDIVATGTYILDKQQKFWSNVYVNNPIKYAPTKYILYILLTALIVYQLSIKSTFNEKDVNLVPIMGGHASLSTILVLVAAVISFSSGTKGPGRSMFELWFYPFAVP